jgi:ribosome biogenesis GTPase A
VLNKSDLADERCDQFVKLIKDSGKPCIKLNGTNAGSKRDITAAMAKLVSDKQAKAQDKGYNKIMRFMVCGIPNTGKSTVINLLSGAKRAQVGDKAGVTRGKQWIRCEGFELLDTPGTTPPSFENQKLAARLAFVGSLNDDILDFDDIALALLEELQNKYPERLFERYEIAGGTPLEMLEKVCARRGFILRGNEYDYERGERAVIDDFRKGKLGRITLDETSDCAGFNF